ncbi:TPA: hypothetical protein ACQD72_001620 [Yersinia enterocolitica]
MPRKVGVLLKIFSNEKYKDEFLRGNLYMNTIDYFRKYEENTDGNVADKNEALSGWWQPNEIKIVIEVNGEKRELNPNDMPAPVTLSMNAHDHANIFCMTHLHSHEIDMSRVTSIEEENKLREYFTLPEDMEKLGEHLVVITDPMLFLQKTRNAAQMLIDAGQGFWYSAKQISYYDEVKSSLFLKNEMEAPFHKQKKYEHQSEYRICFGRDNPNNVAKTLSIGDISDITVVTKTKEFNGLIEISRT